MEKNIEISLLFDFYGQLLSQKQQEIIDLYYNNDLSLFETAEIMGITRQGVRDCLKRCEKQLFSFEEKLGLYKRFKDIENCICEIKLKAEKIKQLTASEKKISVNSSLKNADPNSSANTDNDVLITDYNNFCRMTDNGLNEYEFKIINLANEIITTADKAERLNE